MPQQPANAPIQRGNIGRGSSQLGNVASKTAPENDLPEDKVLSALNKQILEHLEAAGFAKIAQNFKDELTKPAANKRQRSGSQGARHDRNRSASGLRKDAVYGKMSPQQLLLTIQNSFDKGAKSDFFRAFDCLVPLDLKKKDFSYKKLEFYLQIYFVVFKKHPSISRLPHAPANPPSSEADFAEA